MLAASLKTQSVYAGAGSHSALLVRSAKASDTTRGVQACASLQCVKAEVIVCLLFSQRTVVCLFVCLLVFLYRSLLFVCLFVVFSEDYLRFAAGMITDYLPASVSEELEKLYQRCVSASHGSQHGAGSSSEYIHRSTTKATRKLEGDKEGPSEEEPPVKKTRRSEDDGGALVTSFNGQPLEDYTKFNSTPDSAATGKVKVHNYVVLYCTIFFTTGWQDDGFTEVSSSG